MSANVAPAKVTVAEYIAQKIDESGRTQAEIAKVCGFKRPHMVSMLRHGRVRLPFDRIKPLARALRADPREFTLLAIEEYEPELFELMKTF